MYLPMKYIYFIKIHNEKLVVCLNNSILQPSNLKSSPKTNYQIKVHINHKNYLHM